MKLPLIFILVPGCAAHEQESQRFLTLQAEAKTVCEVMANPGNFLGRRVIIKGIYFQTPHERLLVDNNCPNKALSVSHSLHVKGNKEAEAILRRAYNKSTVEIPVVYSATVTSHVVISGCAGPECYRYMLENSQLLAASLHRRH